MGRGLAGLAQLGKRLARDAYAGGVDWRIRWLDGRYALSGWAGYSYISGDSLAIGRVQRSSAHYFQRPDATHLGYSTGRTSMSGYTASIRADKDAGKHILWGAQVVAESPGYEVNDLGRVQSSDDIEYNADIQVRETEPGKYFQNWRFGFVTRGAYNFAGDRTNHEWSQNTTLTFRNLWQLNVNTKLDLETLDDAMTRGGPLMKTSFSRGHEVRVNSPFGGRSFYNARVNWSRDDLGGHRLSLGGNVTIRPAPRWQFSLEPNYQTGTDARQYVTSLSDAGATRTFGRRYIFAFVDRTTLSMKTRLSYAFSPAMTLEGYAEPFAASGRYHDIGELRSPRTSSIIRYGSEGTSIATAADGSYSVSDGSSVFSLPRQDFGVLSFRSNMVLRWEWHPGSTLFVVWQQNRRASDALGETVQLRDLLNTTRAGGDNFLSVKISYWLPVAGGG